MADRPNVVGNILKHPLIGGLIVLFVLLAAAFVANFYFAELQGSRNDAYIGYANNLQVTSQQLGKSATAIANGDLGAYGQLASERGRVRGKSWLSATGQSRHRHPGVTGRRVVRPVSRVLVVGRNEHSTRCRPGARREAMIALRDLTADLAITLSAIQQENNKIVARLVEQGAPANEVALAQRQNVLVERMSRGVDRMVEPGGAEQVASSFNRDSRTFERVLDGFHRR
ncbi:MAG: hypothetical protein U5O39_18405 [Gammaproteobacteria bacterium]|nr:hypothetical protein [Gammaproteobacteria bacterium]